MVFKFSKLVLVLYTNDVDLFLSAKRVSKTLQLGLKVLTLKYQVIPYGVAWIVTSGNEKCQYTQYINTKYRIWAFLLLSLLVFGLSMQLLE